MSNTFQDIVLTMSETHGETYRLTDSQTARKYNTSSSTTLEEA